MKVRIACLAAATLVVLAGCSNTRDDEGGDGGGGGAVASGELSTPELQEAAERLEAALEEPTETGVTEPLSRRPDEGKNITFLQCGVGVCQQIGDELEVAADLLGWNMTFVDQGTSPEQIVAAWDRALSATPRPDAILTSGVPVSLIQNQLEQVEELGIPFVDWASGNPPGTPGILFDIVPMSDNEERGRMLADYAAVQTDGDLNSVFIQVPDFPVLVAEEEAYVAQLEEVCPDTCTNETLDFAPTEIGTGVPSAIVSHLQTNPDVNYVVLSFDDMGTGVIEALRAAGLDQQVTIIGQASNQTTAQSIAEGTGQVATIPQGVGQMAYKALDVLARHFNGDSLDADSELLPIWLQTQDTIGDPNELWKGPEGYSEQFAELWLVDS